MSISPMPDNSQQRLLNPSVKSSRVRSPRLRRAQRSFQQRLRYFYLRFLRLRGSPEAIARGLAVGVFTGFFPIFGLQIFVAIALAALVRGNKIAAAAATWISNAFTSIPIFAFNLQIGHWLLRSELNYEVGENLLSWDGIKELGAELATELFVGSCVVGLIGGIASYFLGLKLIRHLRESRHKNRSSR